MKRIASLLLALSPLWSGASSATTNTSFTSFETAHVRPLAQSPDGKLLFAVNTPDNRLTIYSTTDAGLQLAAEVPVGMEPCAVAVHATQNGYLEAWVVNFLSDSVSIVSINPSDPTQSHVTRTLLVGDEPRDIVFAGPGGGRAFITAAHRGQNRPGDAQLTTQGIGRADVWVFDTRNLGAALGGTPLTILSLFSDSPRALAVTPDGKTVYAAAFLSGNKTTTIAEPIISANGGLPPPPACPVPDTNDCAATQAAAPKVGLIVKFQNGQWLDELYRDWSQWVPFTLPDDDVFQIDASASTPKLKASISGVGSVLYNMAVRPDNGRLYVAATQSFNDTRFVSVLKGHFAENHLSIIDGTHVLSSQNINPGFDYSVEPGPPQDIANALALPTDMVFSPDGRQLYVAAFGSAKVGVFDTNAAESGTISRGLIPVGLGPSGLVLDAARNRLYVMNRIDGSISVISQASNASQAVESQRIKLPFNPEPQVVQAGRRFLYDATISSGHGDLACASCHVFGDLDGLAWDLGDAYGTSVANPNPKNPVPVIAGSRGKLPLVPFHPMKGPMTTQSLRGLADAGPMHWRGDKTAAYVDPGTGQVVGDPLDEEGAFEQFNGAFTDLQGAAARLSDSDMKTFADFMLEVRYPPNPIHALDNSSTREELAGYDLYLNNDVIPGASACQGCHALPLTTSANTAKTAQVDISQNQFKIPHLRNLYQKVGMFGAAEGALLGQRAYTVGDQIRGFGYTHDGSISTIDMFLQHPQNLFNPFPEKAGASPNAKRRNLEQFLLGMDTGLRPIVGQEVTLTAATVSDPDVLSRLQLLLDRADAGDCDLVAKGQWGGPGNNLARGALYTGGGSFITDRMSDGTITTAQLEHYAMPTGQAVTLTAVPPGNGTRIGIDRDLDGARDRDELDAGTSPSDPGSYPSSTTAAKAGNTRSIKPTSNRSPAAR